MLSKLRMNIPELAEIDDTIASIPHKPVPLIGALLVAEGLITQAQLNACLSLQAQDHPGTPLGQILLRRGYISQDALDYILDLQSELKSSLLNSIEEHTETLSISQDFCVAIYSKRSWA